MRGVLGPEPGDCKSIRILNRCLEWTSEGIVYEADPKHVEITCSQLGLDKASYPITTPGVGTSPPEDDCPLESMEATLFRQLIARANFLSQDRPDIQFSVQEISKYMAVPTQYSWELLVRLAKYLRSNPRYLIKYYWQKGNVPRQHLCEF